MKTDSLSLLDSFPNKIRDALFEAGYPARPLPHRELGDRPREFFFWGGEESFFFCSLRFFEVEVFRRKFEITHSLFKTSHQSWDIIARFGRDPSVSAHLPRAFFDDFVRVADDEGKHFLALRDRLEALGSHYGAFEAHDALWHSAAETSHSLPARLAVEHAVHEARGLDVMPMTLHKMRLDPESQALLRVSWSFPSFFLPVS